MARRWRVLNRRRRRALEAGPKCENCGHRENILECRFHPWEKSRTFLCPAHAVQDGFCGGCGLFSSGIESFDFGRFPGYCDNCQDEIASNYSGEDDDGDYEAAEDADIWRAEDI